MRNLCGTIFYIKANVLQDFRICMSVPLSIAGAILSLDISRISDKFSSLQHYTSQHSSCTSNLSQIALRII